MGEYDCGKDDSQYVPCRIPTYRFFAWQFEFVSVPELNDHLWHSAELRETVLGTVDVFGVKVQALKDFSLIDDSDLPETYAFTRSDGRKTLQTAAYLKFRRPYLRLVKENLEG
jgi:hypothetical protein